MKKITHVAVIFNDVTYSMPAPNRHHNILHTLSSLGVKMYGPHKEGFLDEDNNWLSREDAFILASKNGQLNRRKGPEFYQGTDLYSEDIW